MRQSFCLAMALLTILMMTIHSAAAAPVVGSAKALGVYGSAYWGQSAVRSIRHAHDYTQGYRTYAQRVPVILPQIARHETAGAGHNIVAAQKQFGEFRMMTTDKEALASLDLIAKHLAEAAQVQVHMDDMCNAQTIDGIGTMRCCKDIETALNKALDEHEKMVQRLADESTVTAATD